MLLILLSHGQMDVLGLPAVLQCLFQEEELLMILNLLVCAMHRLSAQLIQKQFLPNILNQTV